MITGKDGVEQGPYLPLESRTTYVVCILTLPLKLP